MTLIRKLKCNILVWHPGQQLPVMFTWRLFCKTRKIKFRRYFFYFTQVQQQNCILLKTKSYVISWAEYVSCPFNHLSANPTKWSNTLKKVVGNLPTNCLNMFNYFVGLALKGLRPIFLSYLQRCSQNPRKDLRWRTW